MGNPLNMTARPSIHALRQAYLQQTLTPASVLASLRERIARDAGNPVWISVLDEASLAPYLEQLATRDIASHPLWGIPFAIKDNIDLAGVPTTAACPAFAYVPQQHAPVVQRLLDAGAIPLGKTNLDQFATGLVGTRSPYGEVYNAVLPEYLGGGSSSGSAVAVALGHVAFALGTDTAGSGRVPASLNGLVGVKPSRGLLSTRGVVPACRSLDCVSLFARDLADARLLLSITSGFDAQDDYSRQLALPEQLPDRLRIGVPSPGQLAFFGDREAEQRFADSVAAVAHSGAEIVTIDFSPFREAAELLYGGPWVAERWLTAEPLLQQPDALLAVTRQILTGAENQSAAAAFRAFYRLAALRRAAEPVLNDVTAIMTPTIGRAFLRSEIRAEPLLHNSQLGYYTNFMNLLDLAALAVPAAPFANGLPNGVTLFADAGSDRQLLALAEKLFPHTAGPAFTALSPEMTP